MVAEDNTVAVAAADSIIDGAADVMVGEAAEEAGVYRAEEHLNILEQLEHWAHLSYLNEGH